MPEADLGILIGGFFFRECISNNHLTGGNFHLKVGGAKSSGNAGDPMLGMTPKPQSGRWSKFVLLQKDLFFFYVGGLNPSQDLNIGRRKKKKKNRKNKKKMRKKKSSSPQNRTWSTDTNGYRAIRLE